jgi:hypothetical protein
VRVDTSANPTLLLKRTYLVMMWSSDEDYWTLSGDVEGTPRTYLPEEDACDDAPEDEGGLVGEVG